MATNKLKPIPTNSKLSHLAVEIAEKFRPVLAAGHFTQTDLALAIQQGIDGAVAETTGKQPEWLAEALNSGNGTYKP